MGERRLHGRVVAPGTAHGDAESPRGPCHPGGSVPSRGAAHWVSSADARLE